jgi:acyl-CoA dehydrogenase
MITTNLSQEMSIAEELAIFDSGIGGFLDQFATLDAVARWRRNGVVDRELWRRAGEAGILCPSMPVEYGGAGGDYRHEAAIVRQLVRRGLDGWSIPLHNGIVAPYILLYGNEHQKKTWLPRLASGELVGAIAMTEPGTGSDLQSIRTRAVREGALYKISGAKTFISSGQTANLIIVVAKTDPAAGGRGISLIVLETENATGFRRGRNLDKIGLEIADTSELSFDDVAVPRENLLGETEGQGFAQLMQQLPRERLIIAHECVSIIDYALEVTLDYVRDRKAFGNPIIEFQNTSFTLADAKTEATVTRVFVEHCTEKLLSGTLDASTASMAKLWASEAAQRIVDACLQLHGGYGYMNEYPIARLWKDVRVKRIYGGTSEIMKLLIARSL